jgi:hypothetical protein
MFGEEPPHPLDAVLGADFGLEEGDNEVDMEGRIQEHCAGLAEALAAIIPDVAAARARRHATNEAVRSRLQAPDFEIGDYVLQLSRDRRHKLQMKWLGPRRVVDTVNDLVYVIEDLLTSERSVAHATRLKFYADAAFELTADARDQIAYDERGLCVERIAGWRNTEAGLQLRVHWLGFEPGDATWEPLLTLWEDVPDLIQEFAATRRGARHTLLHDTLEQILGGGVEGDGM